MTMDLRFFIGVFFTILGGLLLIAPSSTAPLAQVPVNLYAGVPILAFGGFMAWLGRPRKS
jgi:hypothetical protein